MSDSSRSQLYYVKEDTLGVVPASALNELRFTGESLAYGIQTTTSNEIRADRQVTDLIRTGAEANGGFNFEMSYGTYDELLAGMLFSSFSTAVAVAASDISASSVDNSFNSTTTDLSVQNISVGQWIRVAGFTEAANNGYFKVVSVAAAKIVVTGAQALVTEASGASVTMDGSMIRNGVTRQSFTFEKYFADVAEYMTYHGMVPSQMNLNVAVGEIVTGDLGFMGVNHAVAGATVGTGAPVAAGTNDVLNAVGNIGHFYEGGTTLEAGAYLQGVTFAGSNNLRSISAIGQLAPADIGSGRFNLTGELTVYFKSRTLYEKYLAGTESSISMRMGDADGNAYILTVPRVEFTTGTVQAGGPDQDVQVVIGYQGVRDPSTDCTLQVDRFPAV